MTHSDVIIGQVVTSSFKLHQEPPLKGHIACAYNRVLVSRLLHFQV